MDQTADITVKEQVSHFVSKKLGVEEFYETCKTKTNTLLVV